MKGFRGHSFSTYAKCLPDSQEVLVFRKILRVHFFLIGGMELQEKKHKKITAHRKSV